MPEPPDYFAQLTNAGYEVIQGNYPAAARIFDLTREGRCPEEVGELAEVLGLMTVKVEARELRLSRAFAEVQHKNAELERAAELQAEFSKLFSGSILLLCVYTMALAFVQNVAKVKLTPLSPGTHLMNLGLFVALGGMMYWFLRRHHYPLSTFGFTLRNWKRSLVESLLVCVPVFGVLLAFKAYSVATNPEFAGLPLIDWQKWEPWQMFVLYLFVTTAQELSTRGFQQTCVERLLTGRYRTAIAILLGAAQFGVVHLHYSFRLGIIAFLGAALFGWLYARHRTILGATVAHYILGQLMFGPLQLIQ